MKENTVIAVIALAIAGAGIVLMLTLFFYHTAKRHDHFQLRKLYVEKCKLTPDQAEKLIPERP